MLTRLPPPLRVGATQAEGVLAPTFPGACWIAPDELSGLRLRLAKLGIVVGRVDDALAGQASLLADRLLLTCDRRAERTYRALDALYQFIE